MGIDATRKWPTEGFARPWPDEVDSDRATRDLVDAKWERLKKELGI
jgi:4-hydroxy-3-polyprenylbenzoate decarboxylase